MMGCFPGDFRARLLVFTMVHNFNLDIIREAAKRADINLASVTTIEALLHLLFPPA